jgi:hypothetical protein
MIDIDLNPVKILPSDHIVLKHYDYAVGVEKKNKVYEKVIYAVIATGVLVLINYVVKTADARDNEKD